MTAQRNNCPEWEYETFPNSGDILTKRAKRLLATLRNSDPDEKIFLVSDTRPSHASYFDGLTPPGHSYYAGHYRGEPYPCLKGYEVGISLDPLVGHLALTVPQEMVQFSSKISTAVGVLDSANNNPNTVITPKQKFIRAVQVTVALFVYFLEIHPYANGNGHVARFLLIGILSRYGFHLSRWPIHPHPDPPYSDLISQYRRGNQAPLEVFVLRHI